MLILAVNDYNMAEVMRAVNPHHITDVWSTTEHEIFVDSLWQQLWKAVVDAAATYWHDAMPPL